MTPTPPSARATAEAQVELVRQPLDVLREIFGHPGFRGIQAKVVEAVLAGRDVLGVMPTGGGKSMCFQVPALCLPGLTLVISPLVALMQDQVAALERKGVGAVAMIGSMDDARIEEIRQLIGIGLVKLLYVAPERLGAASLLRVLADADIRLVAIDEAHCVDQWGHDFRDAYLRVGPWLDDELPEVPRLALTATANGQTRDALVRLLGLRDPLLAVGTFSRPNIVSRVVRKQGKGWRQLLQFIAREHEGHAGIVYCNRRDETEELAAWLVREGSLDARPFHANLPASVKARNLDWFIRSPAPVMVATTAFGMGIDKPDVRFVARTTISDSLESWYQESGRGGRDGGHADAWMAYSPADVVNLLAQDERRAEDDSFDRQRIVRERRLKAVQAWCETDRCREVVLTEWFGQKTAPCGRCDACRSPRRLVDATEPARKALSAIWRTGQRHPALHVAHVLIGLATGLVRDYGHDRLSVFGCGRELTAQQWCWLMEELSGHGLVSVSRSRGIVSLLPDARPVLLGQVPVMVRQPDHLDQPWPAPAPPAITAAYDPEARFHELRLWRDLVAKEMGVVSFAVLTDAALRQIAEVNPATLDELAAVKGVGAAKATRWQEALLLAPGATSVDDDHKGVARRC